jgi:ATP-dependent DNA helicase RecQ
MKAVIVAKTRMGSAACVGALTFESQSLRLIAADRETNDHFNMEYQVGEVWEIETLPDPDLTPPHIENVIVTGKRRMGLITSPEKFIEAHMPPTTGGTESIFEGLAQTTGAGALFIAKRTGIPSRSTMFWRPDRPLRRVDDAKRIRYRYPTEYGGVTLTYVGFQEPVPEIPAQTLLRISLAHWWQPEKMTEGEHRCYVQVSGWFLPEDEMGQESSLPPQQAIKRDLGGGQKKSFESEIPQIRHILQQTFGYPHFRPLQEEIITNVLCKRDTLAVMPTGSGKSLCYQLPAMLFPGLTVVVSPLIALMEDQVLELREWDIAAAYLNSTLSYSAYIKTTARLRASEVKLLYAAPETLLRPETLVLLEKCQVDCLVIDEAHCISEWGHDFRPEYRQLAGLRARLPKAVTLATTATATHRVREDIKASLEIKSANEFVSSFDRENLVLIVNDKISALAQTRAFLDSHKGQSGIIYCATRDQVDNLTAKLETLDYPVLPYHAGMDDETRRAHQHRFHYEDGLIIVATIAFGMGINKSSLRFILHYDLPKNIESYYQQIGRAGRDGLPADCLILYSYNDVQTNRYFIEQVPPELRRGSEMRLKAFLNFIDTQTCRRKPLLAYFGEKYASANCGACDRCLTDKPEEPLAPQKKPQTDVDLESDKVDLSVPTRLLLTCAQETGEIFGADHLIDVLRGSRRKKVLKFGHEKLSSYNAGRCHTKKQWKSLIAQFIRMGLIERSLKHGSLKLTGEGKAVLQGREVWGSLPRPEAKIVSPKSAGYDTALFEKLRALRSRLAEERGLPPFIIFHDRSLIEMATNFPQNCESLKQIYGVGQRKLEKYGPNFLSVISAYCIENKIKNTQKPDILVSPLASQSGQRRTVYIWEQFQAGKSIAEIAAELGFVQSTILEHLKRAHATGLPIYLQGLKANSQLTPEEGQQVLATFFELGDAKLKPVFEALDGDVPYEELHLWRLIFQTEQMKENIEDGEVT